MTECRQNNTTKIEITPETISAGVEQLWDYVPDWSDEKKLVEKIYSAMMAARRSASQ
jgi:hypothetical protein